jgi:hypothetical protein
LGLGAAWQSVETRATVNFRKKVVDERDCSRNSPLLIGHLQEFIINPSGFLLKPNLQFQVELA